jgi:hypothetical protein
VNHPARKTPKDLDAEAKAALAAYAEQEGPRTGAAERSFDELTRRIAEGEVVELPAPRVRPSWHWWAAAGAATTAGLVAAAIGLGMFSVRSPPAHEPRVESPQPQETGKDPAGGRPEVAPVVSSPAVADEEPTSGSLSKRVSRTRRPLAETGDSMAEELRLVRAAREARSPEAMILHLDEHARRFPHGVLSAERMVLKIEALCSLRRESDARREAMRLRRGFPSRSGSPDPRQPCVRAQSTSERPN